MIPRQPVVIAGTFIAYVLVAQFGFFLTGLATVAPPFRPASGIALAALILFGLRMWPVVFAASFTVSLGMTGRPLVALVTAIGATLGGVAGASLVTRYAGGRDVFHSIRSTLRALGFVVLAASIAPIALWIFGQRPAGIAPGVAFVTGWFGQVTGTIVFAPWAMTMIMTEARWPTQDQWMRVGEKALLVISLACVSLGVFAGLTPAAVKTYPLEFLCLPFLMWAAFRFSTREVSIAVVMVSSVAVWGTLRGVGPFADAGAHEAVTLLQAYLTVMPIAALVFATTVDERRRAEARLQELATTDPLTGLVNYRRLLDVLRLEIARSRRTGRSFALLLVDMNGLKQINDRLGHLAGSRAICRTADALRLCTRETDVVARFGGDEFAVVLPESGDEGGTAVLGRVCDRLAQDAIVPTLSVSGGHAVFPRDGDSATLLLRAADRRLYGAKAGERVEGHALEPAAYALTGT
jgi:diguanylate cyclase (GGDEF)-like protein